jgi:cation diffusion facilitator CzcD-associated flavoprotein CzcO
MGKGAPRMTSQDGKVLAAQSAATTCDAVIVGAGFGGMYAIIKLRELGLSVQAFEAGDDVGGTWYWNTYPGARCDLDSLNYSYGFSDELQQHWNWPEDYSRQPDILKYCQHVADRFDLRKDIQFSTRVTSAIFDEQTNRWTVTTDHGDVYSCQFFVTAAGCLTASPNLPAIPGLDSFAGEWYHTGRWPHQPVDFSGKRVGVVGTGSSGIQAIPEIAKDAGHLHVFQRTANFTLPMTNGPMDPEVERAMKAKYVEHRKAARNSGYGVPIDFPDRSAMDDDDETRQAKYEERWRQGPIPVLSAYSDLLTNLDSNKTISEFVRSKIRQTVTDPDVAELLCPKDHPLGSKRLCMDSDYYQTYNRDNVTLVDIRSAPIREITASGIKTADAEYELDIIVFATGYDAVTGPLLAMDIRGRDGLTLQDKWEAGPRNYLGLTVHGFPNMLTITGPGSPSIVAVTTLAIEQHVETAADAIVYMREHGYEVIEASVEAEDAWVDHVNEVASHTLYPQANSWYLGANIPGKPRVFMPYVGGLHTFDQKCKEVAANGYEGFELRGASVSAGTS